MREKLIEKAIDSLVFGHVEGRKERMNEILKIGDRKKLLEEYKNEMGSWGGASLDDGFCDHDSQGSITIKDYSDDSEIKLSPSQVIDRVLKRNVQTLF